MQVNDKNLRPYIIVSVDKLRPKSIIHTDCRFLIFIPRQTRTKIRRISKQKLLKTVQNYTLKL